MLRASQHGDPNPDKSTGRGVADVRHHTLVTNTKASRTVRQKEGLGADTLGQGLWKLGYHLSGGLMKRIFML